MNLFFFKITPILCLEIAWENSTWAAKRAGELAVYNQKVSLFSGTSLGLLLQKAWSHLYPYKCQKFVLAHSTKGKARENSQWCLLCDPGGCRVPGKILIPGHSQFTSHRPRGNDSLFVLLLWREGTLSQALTARLIDGAEGDGWQSDRDQCLLEGYSSLLQRQKPLQFTPLFNYPC